MASRILWAIAFLLMNLGASHANSAALEDYWKSVFGNTLIPRAIKHNLHHDRSNEAQELLLAAIWNCYKICKKSKKSEASDYDDTVTSMFLLEKDLHIGQKLSLHFPKNDNGQNAFMARDITESLPFSMGKLTQILDYFSIKQGSQEAELIEQTLEICEKEAANKRYCATSLESMIDYVASSLGKNVNAFSSTVPKDTVMQEYAVLETKQLGDVESAMGCHRMSYPYTVFLCHKQNGSVPYMVSLVGADGTKVTATAMCHEDTSDWSPEFVGFLALNVKPGTAVCHFLDQYAVIWVRR